MVRRSSPACPPLTVCAKHLTICSGVLLNCGLHHCQMRCHRIKDHSQMPCLLEFEVVCERGHKVKTPCHERNQKFRECVVEDEETERRIKRDLKLEAERQARQEAYKNELQEIQDEIDLQRRMIKYKKEEDDQSKTLAQQRADLVAIKATAKKILDTASSPPSMPGSFPDTGSPTPSSENGESLGIPGGPSEEWKLLKETEGAKSEPMDELMSMIGLDSVKSVFLETKMKVDTAFRQGIPPDRNVTIAPWWETQAPERRRSLAYTRSSSHRSVSFQAHALGKRRERASPILAYLGAKGSSKTYSMMVAASSSLTKLISSR